MRDKARIDRILGKIKTYWDKYPDLRLGQLISNLAPTIFDTPFYFEDDKLEEELDKKLNK